MPGDHNSISHRIKGQKILCLTVLFICINVPFSFSQFIEIKKTVFITGDRKEIRDFFMDETPVTYEDYLKYVNAGGQKNAYWFYESYNISYQPVTGISWHTAIDYCNWRSATEGYTPVYHATGQYDYWGYPVYSSSDNANGYRLPSAAEFEWAANGGDQSILFPWGNNFHDSLANYDTDRGHKSAIWWRLAPVTSQYRNKNGLYNMCGNNWHWCNDWNDSNQRTKKLRGGSWGATDASFLEIKKGSHSSPGNYNYDLGFRCIRYDMKTKKDHESSDTKSYSFLPKISSKNSIVINDFYSEKFISRLTDFISDNYPHCINFIMKIDEQEIISPEQMAFTITAICKKYSVNPLFLTAIMISESGFGTVSFPRWYNNPMAFHWQNRLMEKGYPVYEAKPNVQNRKYKKLSDGFEAFCKGIRRPVYFEAAMKNLDAFHLVYVGYRADEWMHTITRIFKDIAGQRLEPYFPLKEAGKLIYTDWEGVKNR